MTGVVLTDEVDSKLLGVDFAGLIFALRGVGVVKGELVLEDSDECI